MAAITSATIFIQQCLPSDVNGLLYALNFLIHSTFVVVHMCLTCRFPGAGAGGQGGTGPSGGGAGGGGNYAEEDEDLYS